MFLQLLTIHKRIMQLIYQFSFFIGQAIWIFGIYGWEISITHFIFHTFIDKYASLEINLLQQLPVLHTKLRTAINNIRFQLKLYNCNGLMHLRDKTQCLLIVCRICKIHFRCKNSTGVIGISIHSKSCQWQKINAISIFKCTQITITHGHTNHICHTARITRCSSYPENIMVAPLDIKIMIIT